MDNSHRQKLSGVFAALRNRFDWASLSEEDKIGCNREKEIPILQAIAPVGQLTLDDLLAAREEFPFKGRMQKRKREKELKKTDKVELCSKRLAFAAVSRDEHWKTDLPTNWAAENLDFNFPFHKELGSRDDTETNTRKIFFGDFEMAESASSKNLSSAL